MSFGSLDSGTSRPMADINTTPLVDVMLVLLIIFLVTAPLMTQGIKVDLPKAPSVAVNLQESQPINLSLDAAGQVWLDKEAMVSLAVAEERLRAAISANPEIEVRLSADRATRYEQVAEIMATARRAGVVKLGFVSLPAGE